MFHHLILSLVLSVLLLSGSAVSALAGSGSQNVRVIIGFKSALMAADDSLILDRGGAVTHRFRQVDAISAEIPANQMAVLRTSGRVAYIEIDSKVQAIDILEPVTAGLDRASQAAGQTVPWGIQSIKAADVQAYNQGRGVKVAVLDTGIDLTHPDLKVSGHVNLISPAKTGNDDNGHGSHVAGTVAALNNSLGVLGAAPQAELYAVKVLDSNGSGYWSTVISGIEWAIDHNMNIINLSLGSGSGSIALKEACDKAYKAGILIVAAAGNSGRTSTGLDNVVYPARYDSVVAVGAVDSANRRPGFSSTGPQVELAAPGVNIYSTYLASGYTTLQGTSMASPHAAGVAALVWASGIKDASADGRLNDDVRLRLQQTADDLGAIGRDPVFGFGLVNALRAAPQPVNSPPQANAGPDRSVLINTHVILDGAGSPDLDGDVLTWHWRQTAGIVVDLSASGSAHPGFLPVEVGEYDFELIVNDGQLDSQPDEVRITARANSPPVAPQIAIRPAAPVTADDLLCVIVAESNDPDGDPVSYRYQWFKNGAEQNGLTGAVVNASMTARGDVWTCLVTPNDGFEDGLAVSAQTLIGNSAPTARAGADRNVMINMAVSLDASASIDADGDPLTYQWVQTEGPVNLALAGPDSVSPAFTADTPGRYVIQLTVTDSFSAASSDTLTVNVQGLQDYTLHCQSVELTLTQRYGGSRTTVSARVVVVDAFGVVVSGVTVKGHWSGVTTGTLSAKTNASGLAVLNTATSRSVPSGSVFIFTVDSLSKSGWNYDPAANEQGSGSVQVP